MPLTLVSPIDWDTLFQSVKKRAYMPDCSLEKINKYNTIVRDMVVDLEQLQRKLDNQGPPPYMITVYADVVKLPDSLEWNQTIGSLVIIARRIEASPKAQVILDYTKKKSAELLLYAKEITGSLQVNAVVSKDNPIRFPISSLDSIGVKIYFRDGAPMQKPLLNLPTPSTTEGSDFHLLLISEFLYATVMIDEHPDEAELLLLWIRFCSSFSDVFSNLLVQSSSLLVMLQTRTSGAQFVPVLSPHVYTDTASAYVTAAHEYERQYERFIDLESDLDSRIDAATLMLADSTDKMKFDKQLILQCENNLRIARKAANDALKRFNLQKSEVQNAAFNFKLGLERWKEQQEWKATWSIITSVLDFTFAITSIVVTAGAAAPEAVAKGKEAIEQAAKNSESLSKAMTQLSAIIEVLGKVYDMAIKIEQAAESLSQKEGLAGKIGKMDLNTANGADLSSGVYWKQFQLEADSQMQPALSAQIQGAVEYKLELNKLALFGQDLAMKQVAMVEKSEQLVRLKLKQENDQARQIRLQQYVEKLKNDHAPNTEMMQQFFWRYLDQKIGLFVALENYIHAYNYWALQPSNCRCSMMDKVDGLGASLVQIQNDYMQALELFDPHPQSFKNISYNMNDPSKLEMFRKTGTITFNIGLSDTVFANFNRVRVESVQIKLVGAHCDSAIELELETSGAYQDRWKNQPMGFFITEGLLLSFVYNPNTGEILVDGRLADEEKYAYFVPTPFTEWELSLPKDTNYNKHLDLSGLNQIELIFSGSLMGRGHN